ncbi:MAG: response regulator [Siculibacillus sp.]|nr:response regulator [Siculibacillus sp.]
MNHRSEPPPSPLADPALAGLRVLVVEDHAIGRILLEAMLAGLGVVARLAASGEEAKEASGSSDFDVVLIDLGLPDVHGEDLARALARLAHGRRPLFVAVTGRERPTVLPSVFAEWLEKPFSVRELHRLLTGLGEEIARSA